MDKETKQKVFAISLKGEVEVRGKKIKHLEGGFGENCRIILDKDIAEEHEVTPSDIRKLINRNIKRFKEGIDYIDISKGSHQMTTSEIESFGYKKTAITQASNIYVLSERGYSKIIKIMDTDLAWEIYDDLLDGYFSMRQELNNKLDSYMISDPISRARRWIEEEEERQALREDNKKKQQEIEHKENVIIGLTEEIDLADKRQRISQIIKYGANKNYPERYNLLYSEFDAKYHVNVQTRLDNAKERGDVKRSVNKMGYICDYMGMTSQLYDVACKVFESDYIELLKEWTNTIERHK